MKSQSNDQMKIYVLLYIKVEDGFGGDSQATEGLPRKKWTVSF